MDHLGSSSSNTGIPHSSQGEPFFDLLQPNSNSGYHGAQISPPVYFSNDDVLPSMDFQPIVDTIGKGKVDDSKRGWQQSQPASSVRFLPLNYRYCLIAKFVVDPIASIELVNPYFKSHVSLDEPWRQFTYLYQCRLNLSL